MKSKLINAGREKTWAVVFETGDEVIEGLTAFAHEQGLSASHFTAVGALSGAMLGCFNIEKKDYKRIPITEQVEVLSLMGDIVLQNDEPKVHAHVVLGKSDGTAWGGHLLHASVRPTLEVILIESPAHLQRKTDENIGLALIDLNDSEELREETRP
jgi:predicted DNA-binding protein with PD1-like motif